jgi:peptide subunit release factor 1 (eRF1)
MNSQESIVAKLHLKRSIEELESVSGRSTSLVSLIIPAGGNVSRMLAKVNDVRFKISSPHLSILL